MLHRVKGVHKIQVIRFLLVGAFCAGVEFILFWLLVHLYHIPYLQANMGSLLVAVVLNYFISRKVVFEKGRYSGKVEFTAFLVFSAMGVALNQFLIWYFVEQTGVNVNLGKVLAIGLAAVFNYFTKKHIVFKK
jgi:putative flippase GtrA